MTIAERIRERRAALSLTQARLAAELGVDQSTVAKWERGPNSPRSSTLQYLAERLHVSVSWLISGEEPVQRPAAESVGLSLAETARVLREPVGRGQRDLPVLGVAVGGEDACFDFNGQVQEYLERPSQLESVHNAYALYVLGDSMRPRYLEGEIVYVNPNRPITRGCFVAVEFKTADGFAGKGMIKQFVKRTPTKLVLRQLNPDRVLEVTADEVKHYHRIVQSGEP